LTQAMHDYLCCNVYMPADRPFVCTLGDCENIPGCPRTTPPPPYMSHTGKDRQVAQANAQSFSQAVLLAVPIFIVCVVRYHLKNSQVSKNKIKLVKNLIELSKSTDRFNLRTKCSII
jgi:hypothetical protein